MYPLGYSAQRPQLYLDIGLYKVSTINCCIARNKVTRRTHVCYLLYVCTCFTVKYSIILPLKTINHYSIQTFFCVPLTGSPTACAKDEETTWMQEHVFTIPYFLYGRGDPHILVTTSSRKPVSVSLTIPGVGFEMEKDITKDSTLFDIDLSLSNIDGDDIRMLPGFGSQNKTIIVRSSDAVNVHAISDDNGGDGFIIIPTNQLGTKHYLASYQPSSKYDPPFVCITALHTNTSVYIKTKSRLIRKTLWQDESYRFDGEQYEDLSGALVQSDKPIAVISGVYSKVPNNSRGTGDGLIVHIPPTSMWGVKFSIVPFRRLDPNTSYLYRVQTLNISTTLHISDGRAVKIRPEVESFYEADYKGDAVISFTSDQPVMVIQYLKSDNSHSPLRGGPAMLIIPPVTQFGSNVTFPVFQFADPDKYTYFITVIAECTTFDNWFKLNDTEANLLQKQAENTTMCYVNREVSSGPHSITHSNPMATFYVSVYYICEKCESSYAYSANAYYPQGKLLSCKIHTAI